MKTALMFVTLFYSVLDLPGQVVYFSFQPLDLAIGVRADLVLDDCLGIYGSVSRGNYMVIDGSSISHVKSGFGFIRYEKRNSDRVYSFLTSGISFNNYGPVVESINPRAFSFISMDVGFGGLFKNLSIGVRFDPVKRKAPLISGLFCLKTISIF